MLHSIVLDNAMCYVALYWITQGQLEGKHFWAPAKNPHLFLLTSHKTGAFTINNKASVLFYSSGRNGRGSGHLDFYVFDNVEEEQHQW